MVLSIGKVFGGEAENILPDWYEAHPDHEPAVSIVTNRRAYVAGTFVALSQEAGAVV
jgi:hypothetical protein